MARFVFSIYDCVSDKTGKFDTWTTSPGRVLYLEDIFIDEEYRRYGIGSAFFKILAKEGYLIMICQ